MAQMLKLSNRNFKVISMKMLNLAQEVDDVHEAEEDYSRVIQII